MLTRVRLRKHSSPQPRGESLSVGLEEPRIVSGQIFELCFLGMVKWFVLLFDPLLIAGVRKEVFKPYMAYINSWQLA